MSKRWLPFRYCRQPDLRVFAAQRPKGCARLAALIVGELPVPSRSAGDHAPPARLGHNLVRIDNGVR